MTNVIHKDEYQSEIFGVPVRMENRILDTKTGLFRNQSAISERRPINGYAPGATLQVNIRFDDQCKNGKQSFAITAEVQEPRKKDISAGGCLHDDIAKVFPEFAPLIKWHLFDTAGPMHYLANACYLAGDRDHNGKLKGEPWAWDDAIRFGNFPMSIKIETKFRRWLQAAIEFNRTAAETNPAYVKFEPLAVDHGKDSTGYKFSPKYTFRGFECKWHECPFEDEREAREFAEALSLPVEFVRIPTLYSEGKERELDLARSAACWPDASDEQLCAPRDELEKTLIARLPKLIADFEEAMQACGFEFQQKTVKAD